MLDAVRVPPTMTLQTAGAYMGMTTFSALFTFFRVCVLHQAYTIYRNVHTENFCPIGRILKRVRGHDTLDQTLSLHISFALLAFASAHPLGGL
jgi:hypothetical protein